MVSNGSSELWSERIHQVMGPHSDLRAFELASVMQEPVSFAHWASALAEAGLEPVDLGPLLDAGLVVSTPDGTRWAWKNRGLPTSLRGMAQRAGRLEDWHAAAAQALIDEPSGGDQRALHLVRAGRLSEAVEPLLAVVLRHLYGRRGEHTTPILTAWHDVARRLSLPDDDPRHIVPLLLEGEHLRWRSDMPLARTRAERAADLARAHDEPARLAHALTLQARVAMMLDAADAALRLAGEAQAVAEGCGSKPMRGYALWIRGVTLARLHGDPAAGEVLLQQFVSDRDHAWLPESMGAGYQALLQITQIQRKYDDALHWADVAWDYSVETQHIELMAHTANDRGMVLWRLRDLEGAEASFRTSLELHESRGRSGAGALGNLATLALETGKPDVAEPLLGEVLEAARLGQPRWFVGAAFSQLTHCFALQGRWERFDRALSRSLQELSSERCYSEEIPGGLTRAAALAAEAGHVDRARTAYQLALGQWRLLKQEAEAAAVEEAMGRLATG